MCVEKLEDGPAEPDNYVMFADARGGAGQTAGADYPAVTITLAKRKGTNATAIAENVLARVNSLRGYVLPNDVNVTVTRNYGETAKEKSNELLFHMLIAVLSVTSLIALTLGCANPASCSSRSPSRWRSRSPSSISTATR